MSQESRKSPTYSQVLQMRKTADGFGRPMPPTIVKNGQPAPKATTIVPQPKSVQPTNLNGILHGADEQNIMGTATNAPKWQFWRPQYNNPTANVAAAPFMRQFRERAEKVPAHLRPRWIQNTAISAANFDNSYNPTADFTRAVGVTSQRKFKNLSQSADQFEGYRASLDQILKNLNKIQDPDERLFWRTYIEHFNRGDQRNQKHTDAMLNQTLNNVADTLNVAGSALTAVPQAFFNTNVAQKLSGGGDMAEERARDIDTIASTYGNELPVRDPNETDENYKKRVSVWREAGQQQKQTAAEGADALATAANNYGKVTGAIIGGVAGRAASGMNSASQAAAAQATNAGNNVLPYWNTGVNAATQRAMQVLEKFVGPSFRMMGQGGQIAALGQAAQNSAKTMDPNTPESEVGKTLLNASGWMADAYGNGLIAQSMIPGQGYMGKLPKWLHIPAALVGERVPENVYEATNGKWNWDLLFNPLLRKATKIIPGVGTVMSGMEADRVNAAAAKELEAQGVPSDDAQKIVFMQNRKEALDQFNTRMGRVRAEWEAQEQNKGKKWGSQPLEVKSAAIMTELIPQIQLNGYNGLPEDVFKSKDLTYDDKMKLLKETALSMAGTHGWDAMSIADADDVKRNQWLLNNDKNYQTIAKEAWPYLAADAVKLNRDADNPAAAQQGIDMLTAIANKCSPDEMAQGADTFINQINDPKVLFNGGAAKLPDEVAVPIHAALGRRCVKDQQFMGNVIKAKMESGANGPQSSSEAMGAFLGEIEKVDPAEYIKKMDDPQKFHGMVSSLLNLSAMNSGEDANPELKKRVDALKEKWEPALQEHSWELIKKNPLEALPLMASLFAQKNGFGQVAEWLQNPLVFYGMAALLLGGGLFLGGKAIDGLLGGNEAPAPRRDAGVLDRWSASRSLFNDAFGGF